MYSMDKSNSNCRSNMLIHKQIPYINITFKPQCMGGEMYLWWRERIGGARGSDTRKEGEEKKM